MVGLLAGCQSFPLFGGTTTTTTTSTTTTTTTSTTTTTTIPPVLAEGTVSDAGGRPVAGVEVSFGDAFTSTDASGRFELSSPEPGVLALSKRMWRPVEIDWARGEATREVTLEPEVIRGIRVGAGAAGSDEHFTRLLDLAAATAVNTFVFDTKQEGGTVVYDTAVATAHEIGAVDAWYDPAARVAQARDAGLYTITRIVTLEDAFWAKAHPEEKMAGPWNDPTGPGILEYTIDLATEACALGFDEIQLDYVRYAAGRTAAVTGQRDLTQEQRVANIGALVSSVREAVAPMGCGLSADIFGIVVSVPDDQGLGQRPEDISVHLEAVSPMVYPSHYSDGWLGFPDPNDHPYDVTANALDSALPRLAEGAVLRPWLQAFWWTDAQIRSSIQAAEDRGVGWLLWNVGSSFSAVAIPTDDETAGGE